VKSISNRNFTDGIKEGWINVKIFLSNTPEPVTGVTGLSYNEVNTKTALYGGGNEPIGYAVGNYEYDGEITLYENEVTALQKIAQNQGDVAGSITSILPFDIIITIDKTGTAEIKRHVLKNVVFQSNGRQLTQGDGAILVTIPLLFSKILWV
jgi:hypothetical protein